MKSSYIYSEDILGGDFQQLCIPQPDDYEGKVVCTLVRKNARIKTQKAVLYVHGFNDYFFQTELADRYNAQGLDFYALDLRKYGRSYLSHQKLNNVRNLKEYYEDVNSALQIIKDEEHTEVILMGHSTGGLIISVFANDHLNSNLFHAVIMNSPFFDFNANPFMRKIIVPLVAAFGKSNPNTLIKGGFSDLYGISLHASEKGEWNYNLLWKPHVPDKVNFGFISAIYQAQKKICKGIQIKVPFLVMHSDNSLYEKKWSEKMFTGDAVLNVNHIHKNALRIKGIGEIKIFKNALHDIILSKKPVRDEAYECMFQWIHKYMLPSK